MYSQTHRKTRFFAAAAFSILFMMLFAFIIPGMKASAATKNYTAPCTGSSIFYSGTGVTYITPDSRVTIQGQGVSAGVGKFTITVKPNTNTSQRIITLKAKKGSSGAVVDSIVITQAAAPSPQYITLPSPTTAVSCVGGQVYCSVSGKTYEYLDKNVCNSHIGNNLVVNPNTGTSFRSGQVNIRDGYGILRAVVTIRQSGVPKSYPPQVACTGGTVPSPASGADYSKTDYSNKAVCDSISGGKFIVKPNNTTSEQNCTITVKNSAGIVIYYIYIKQAAVPRTTESIQGSGGSFTRKYQTTAKLTPTLANTTIVTSSAPSGGWYTYRIDVNANPSSTANRYFDINVKNSSNKLIEVIHVTQSKYTQASHVHDYVYITSSNHVYSRKCKYCTDGDNNISYREYIKYNKDKGLTDCETSVKSYMNALGYDVNSTESKNMVIAYNCLHSTKPLPPLLTLDELQEGLQNLKDITDNMTAFLNFNSTVSNSVNIVNTVNHLQMFLTQDNPGDNIGNAVKLAGDFFSFGIAGEFSGDYFGSALNTVGDALKKTVPLVLKKQDADLKAALKEYDFANDNYIAGTSKSKLDWDRIKAIIEARYTNDKTGVCILSKKQLNEKVDKVRDWKTAFETQKALNYLYTNMGFRVTVSTNKGFWTYVETYIQ